MTTITDRVDFQSNPLHMQIYRCFEAKQSFYVKLFKLMFTATRIGTNRYTKKAETGSE
jgi:hypothetical protein